MVPGRSRVGGSARVAAGRCVAAGPSWRAGERIRDWIQQRNSSPRPFAWKRTLAAPTRNGI